MQDVKELNEMLIPIDVSKYFHKATIVGPKGEILEDPFEIDIVIQPESENWIMIISKQMILILKFCKERLSWAKAGCLCQRTKISSD